MTITAQSTTKINLIRRRLRNDVELEGDPQERQEGDDRPQEEAVNFKHQTYGNHFYFDVFLFEI